MGKLVRLQDFRKKVCKATLSLTERLGVADLKERNEEFMDFLARERCRLVVKVAEISHIMDTISKEWGIEIPPVGPPGD